MNFKELLLPLSLALVTVWGVQYFLSEKQPKDQQPKSGQSFVAPTQQEMAKPLQTAITFVAPGQEAPIRTDVRTKYGDLAFTSHTGSLEAMSFVRDLSGQKRVLAPLAAESPERYGFVVALDGENPFIYSLIDKIETQEATVLTYRGESPSAIISKQFTVNNLVPKIDMRLTVEPRVVNEKGLQTRVFIPAPWIAHADEGNVSNGLVFSDRQRVQKQKIGLLANQFWFTPTFFGAEDRYFVFALIGDPEGYARRGYYSGTTSQTLEIILEGPAVKEKTSWTLSFYFGPKDAHLMDLVDPRLSATLDYGWLSPLVKILLAMLKFLYGYVKNYGWAIILLTLLIRLIMLPVTLRGNKALEKQKEFQRKMQYIDQKYKNDQEALSRERMELTRKYGMSNVLGCLPQLAQLPILLGLNRLLSTSVELYQAPFFGWITDLSARDPYYILPLLAGAGLLIQVTTDSDARRGITMLLFAALLVAVTAHLSAGLTLYLCANTWLSIGQVYFQKVFKI
jgi:YidC/Oxa1 family membrane protein insertase